MNAMDNMQPNAQEFFKNITEANKKAWELSSEYMKKDFERQSTYFNEMAEAGRNFYGTMAETASSSENPTVGATKHFEKLQERYSEIMQEQTEAFQELQKELKEIYAPVMTATDVSNTEGKKKPE